ncbi:MULTISPECIES: hypothetical protein [Bacillaceae]|uniref:Uncharacterized protein n=1 Tax=Gottfriedia luciferensis TaxID=178774 RepID=A0ABX2ZR66_9BACI|nr:MULTISPECIES: hypothetical protein [Bacillaceae]ODG90987.1 hypothetical protein BED47_08080 [Gottfriedia luciferensis]PGZ87773.1 hypothetical protein COE53_20730 [Bacillus sp. AFS029533]
MLTYYSMLIAGLILILSAGFIFMPMFIDRVYSLVNISKSIGCLLLGVLLLTFTLPSLKNVLFKQYDVVSGRCVIEIDSSSRTSEADFYMQDTDEIFTYRDIPKLDAYGKSVPYYCKVTVTKDHNFEVSYKIYNSKTRKLILASE